MELVAQSLPLVKNPKSVVHSSSSVPLCSYPSNSSVPSTSLKLQFPEGSLTSFRLEARKQKKKLGPIKASEAPPSPPTESEERWLLEPVGDGDSKHIGYKVEMPGAFEIASIDVTVGRVPEKADLVIPVATVSGVHARIQKKRENLLVTDLDSTNGTFIGDKRLRPGVVATVSSGSYITFGDVHLAQFRVSKIENVEPPERAEESDEKFDTDGPIENAETG